VPTHAVPQGVVLAPYTQVAVFPSQLPPHGDIPWLVQLLVAWGLPAGMVVHIPKFPATSHAWQALVQGSLQQ
jgi:hypothetical protein